jgi:hypothetical protein
LQESDLFIRKAEISHFSAENLPPDFNGSHHKRGFACPSLSREDDKVAGVRLVD